MKTSRLSLLVLLLGVASSLYGGSQPQEHENEEGCIGQREIEYRRRHADLDPEGRLYLAQTTYAELRHEPRTSVHGIGGSVWTSIGPGNLAGRIGRIAVHPTVAGTLLAGAAGGGVWKTTDSGTTWSPLTEAIPNLFIGAVAYAPSNPSTIYVGTGEGDVGIPAGIGLIWSTDGGVNWNFPSTVIADTFYAINVHPTNPNDIVIGTSKGALRSTAGPNGPWTSVIAGQSTPTAMAWGSVTDIERDPTNANVLYAATFSNNFWCAAYACPDPYRFYSPTVLKSADGGATWSSAATGLVSSTSTIDVARWAIAIAPSSPSTLYAATSTYDSTTGTSKSHIYKTTNGGGSWSETALSANASSLINNYLIQTNYDNAIAVSPSDPNTVVAGGVFYVRTVDGGTTWTRALQVNVHVDVHDLAYSSTGVLYVANDGGFYTSGDHGVNGTAHNAGLVTRQFYTLAIDPPNRDRAYGGQQDNGTSLRAGATTAWTDFAGGDGGGCAVDPGVSSYAIASAQNGVLFRSVDANAASPEVFFGFPVLGISEGATFVSVITPHPALPGIAYTGTWRVWKTTTFGDAWAPLPTTTTDGSPWFTGYQVNDVAVAASNPQTLMVALTSNVKRSIDGGNTWTTVMTGLPNANINRIEIDPANDQTAYAALAATDGNSIYRTTNGGATWIPRSSGLPLWEAQVVRVDPTDSNTLYAGTEVGLYRSTDQGASWSRFGTGLPAVAVYDIRISSDGSILRAATHGRGIWELAITGNTNTQPAASISTPATSMTIAAGTTVTFSGSVSDPDGGNTATGLWIFPDTWEQFNAPSGASTVQHAFHRAGVFPVTLRAKDSHGAMATAYVKITVTGAGDSCANPIVIPGSGPFPIATRIDSTTATTGGSDPNPISSCSGQGSFQTIWLSFTPAETGTYDFSFCGSRIGGVLALHTGASCGPYTPIANGCLAVFSGQHDCTAATKLSVSLQAGVTVRILTQASTFPPYPYTLTISRTSSMPAVFSIAPDAGPTSGGREIVLYGAGFTSPTTVTVGGVAATNVVIADSKILTATVPAHAAGSTDVVVTTAAGTATLNGGYTYTSRALDAPASLAAAPNGAGGMAVTWSGVAGANQYEVFRRASGGYTSVGLTSSTSLTDNSASSGVAYLYKVRALGLEGATSVDSNADLATNALFTEDPFSPAVTPIRAAHVNELRTAINAVRATAGLGAYGYTGTVAANGVILATHVLELRTALDEARSALTLPPLSYANAIHPGALIRATDLGELRSGVK